MILKRLSSAISTAHAVSLAIREMPDALRECVGFARGNAELREELERANRCLEQHNEKRVKEITTEFELNKQVSDWRNWARAFSGCDGSDSEIRTAVEVEVQKIINHWTSVCSEWRGKCEHAQKERDGLKSQLATYEDAERWHQVTDCEGELPPSGLDVLYKLSPLGAVCYGAPYPACLTFAWRYLSSQDVPR